MNQLRQTLVGFINGVCSGNRPRGYSSDTVNVGGRCAQLVRESVETALNLGANNWEVANAAHDYRKARGGVDRWASDYEKAGKALGLEKPYDQMLPGDVAYWPYQARNGNNYGHTALFVGEWGGEKWYLENSDWAPAQRRSQGAKLPLGDVHVYVTPESKLTRPRTVITPTRAMLQADRAVSLPPALTPAPPAATVDSIGPLPGQPARLPFVRLLDRSGQMVVTPHTKAAYWGLIEFERVPGGVIIRPLEEHK